MLYWPYVYPGVLARRGRVDAAPVPLVRTVRAARLDGLIGALLDIAEPFGPLGAQMLWVAQPTLRLLVPRDDIAALARLLEAPGGVAWLREQLIGMDDHDR